MDRPAFPDSILDALNPAQREAASIMDGPLMVLAGAGTGKTRTITHRIAWMIEQGVPASAILAVTFTNKAAREMRERVRHLTGRYDVRLNTFHSFCVMFLREEFPVLGRAPDFSIYDDGDALSLVKRVLDDASLDLETHKAQTVLNKIGRWKMREVPPREAQDTSDSLTKEVARIYEAYDRALVEANACDFDDLLLQALRILRDHDEVRARWNRRLTHVLVDEFQDTNTVQYALVQLLTADTGNLCVTGDQDQSIYSWRGAEPGNFDQFLEDHPEAPIVRLEQNYRSTKHILGAAASVISCNRYRIPKTLWTDIEDAEPVRVVGFVDDYDEARAIAKAIRDFEAEGIRPETIAVFYRTNALSLPVERTLLQEGIPYIVVGGLEFFGRQEVKDLLAYLRFLANPRDVVSLARILNVPPRGIGKKTREQVVTLAATQGRPIGDLLRDPDAFTDFTPRARAALTDFAEKLERFDSRRESPVGDLINEILNVTGYAEYWQKKSSKSGSLEPYQNLGQFVTLAQEFDRLQKGRLPEFLTQVALLTDHDRTERRDHAVSLMTLHTSKGLEFEAVVLIGAEHGMLPHAMSSDSLEGFEEERRLFHVGMTRAKRRLVITWAGARTRFGRRSAATPSPFLDELGDVGVEHHGGPTAEAVAIGERVEWDDDAHPLAQARRGTPVWHPDWGSGEIVGVQGRGQGLDRKAVVEFEDGRRVLVLRHSNLELREDDVF